MPAILSSGQCANHIQNIMGCFVIIESLVGNWRGLSYDNLHEGDRINDDGVGQSDWHHRKREQLPVANLLEIGT